jgi:dihydrodipicolinate synthase/N-acetylneuraminate lyase
MFESILDCPAFVTELLCVFPEVAFGLYDAARAKDSTGMYALMNRLIPYHKFISDCVARREVPTVLGTEVGGRATALYQSIIKKAMELRGLPGGVVREPLENITDAETAELRDVLVQIGAL